MNVRTIILSVATGLVVIALFVLFLQVRGNAAVEVPEQALAEALQRHERAKAARSRPDPVASRPVQEPLPRPRKPRPAKPAETQPEDLPDERPRPRLGIDLGGGEQPMALTRAMQRGKALRERMDEANKLYDRRDYEAAITAAQEILRDMPRNVRMLRVVVSSACIMGEEGLAREHFGQLPERDQRQMSVRCKRYGMDFEPTGGDSQ